MIKKKTIALFGVAGSGKTTKCLELIQKYLKDYELSDIAFTTYTRAGIESIKQKLESADIFLPDENNFGTMHSLCWKLAQFEHKILNFRKYKEFCIEHMIDIEREEEEDKTTGEYLLEIYEFIQNIKAKRVTNVSAAEINKILLEKYQEDEKITQNERDNLIRLLGVFIKWKEKNGLHVYSDALIDVLENKIDVPASVLIVDEAQDLFETQIQIIKMWTEEHDKDVFILAGDDDQCSVSGTKIYRKGLKEDIIDNVKNGDLILSATGKGSCDYREVLNTTKSIKKTRFITIKTKTGQQIETTDDHLFFVNLAKNRRHYVYLMKKEGLGFRIGITTNLKKRLYYEKGADSIWVLKTCKDIYEATIEEEVMSLKYGIPTACFTQRHRAEIITLPKIQKELHKKINSKQKANELAIEENIDLNYPIHTKKGVKRGTQTRLTCNLNFDWIKGQMKNAILSIDTEDKKYLEKIKEIGCLNLRKRKTRSGLRGTKMGSLKNLQKITNNIKKNVPGVIIVQKAPIVKEDFSFITPAKNLFVGALIPVFKENKIVLDEIVDIVEKVKEETVFDLEIDKTYNFVANGVVIHNCVHNWAGSDPTFLIESAKNADEKIILEKTYRCPPAVTKICNKILKEIKYREPKKIRAQKLGGKWKHIEFPRSVLELVRELDEKEESFWLFRTNNLKKLLSDYLFEWTNIPFSYLGQETSPYSLKYCLLHNAIVKLSRQEALNFDEACKLVDAIKTPLLQRGIKTNFKKQKGIQSVSWQEFTNNVLRWGFLQHDKSFDVKKELLRAIQFQRLGKNPTPKMLEKEDSIKRKIGSAQKLLRFKTVVRGKRSYCELPLRLGTFHASKGLQAKTVFVFLGTSEYFTPIDDSELRCLYVACSRASEKLVTVVTAFERENQELAEKFNQIIDN